MSIIPEDLDIVVRDLDDGGGAHVQLGVREGVLAAEVAWRGRVY